MNREDSLPLKAKRVLIAATGSIAAVKTPLLVSALVQAGAEVKCVITPSASKLVSPASLASLSRNRCYQEEDQWASIETRPLHISLIEWAEILVVAPLSATSLGKWVNGIGDTLVTSLLLACEKPVIAAPAMNTAMWENIAVKKNWEKLLKDPRTLPLPPSKGLLACDRFGEGKVVDPDLIQLAICSALMNKDLKGFLKKDFSGTRVLISAGPTIEFLDPARIITNRSSGRMGVMLAQAASFRGAYVDLVHGPLQVSSGLLAGLYTHPIKDAEGMKKVLSELQGSAEFIAMAAAVGDLKHKGQPSKQKMHKAELVQSLNNALEIVPDIISEMTSKRKGNQTFLGFAALCGTEEEIKIVAEKKRCDKGCDLLMANPIDIEGQGFETDFNGGWLIGPAGKSKALGVQSKLALAHQLLDELVSFKENYCATN